MAKKKSAPKPKKGSLEHSVAIARGILEIPEIHRGGGYESHIMRLCQRIINIEPSEKGAKQSALYLIEGIRNADDQLKTGGEVAAKVAECL